MSRRWIITIVAIVLVVVGGLVFWRVGPGRQEAATIADLETVPAARGPITATIGATGTVRVNQSALLVFKASGTVENVYVSPGEFVEQGALLADLQKTSLTPQVILAQADLISAQRALDEILNSQVARDQARLAVAQAEINLRELTSPAAIAEAQRSASLAEQALEDAEDDLSFLISPAVFRWERRVAQAKLALESAKSEFESSPAPESQDLVAEAEEVLREAESNLASSRRRYLNEYIPDNFTFSYFDEETFTIEEYLDPPTEVEIDEARAAADLAAARLDEARALVAALTGEEHPQDGSDSGLTNLEQSQIALQTAQLELARSTLADAQRTWERVMNGPDPDDIASAEARIAAAQATLDTALVIAPFAGTVTSVDIKAGDAVSPGTRAVELADLSRLLVEVDIPEIDINKVLPNQPVVLVFDAIPQEEYHGHVLDVGLTGSEVQGLVSYRVTLALTDPDQAIKAGMTAAVSIIVAEIEDALLVPNRAVRVEDGQRVVYVVREQALEQITVILGESSETHSQVLDGDLLEGDQIVLTPPSNLSEFGRPRTAFGRFHE